MFAGYRLQDVGDFRAAIRDWMGAVRIGGHLVIVVPHAFLFERSNALPSRWRPEQRRLYTPAALLDEVEEALIPNSYRVRWLGDLDNGYNYRLERSVPPVGRHDIALVLERTPIPDWDLTERQVLTATGPDFAFEPGHTRLERPAVSHPTRILVLKLDHLGDFIMGLPALERLRTGFPDAEITLVVGSWNVGMAEETGLFERVVAFDVFPRNSTEEKVDVHGKTTLFRETVTGEYDIAIDLRNDDDTRFLLPLVRADIRAGMGNRAKFPYLDIFLPVDATRHGWEAVRIEELSAREFDCRGVFRRTHHQIAARGDLIRQDGNAVVWGPYRHLLPGQYLFEPHIDIDPRTPGLVAYDIAVDEKVLHRGVFGGAETPPMIFRNETDGGRFEFRLWPVDDEPLADFQFFGGRLVRQGASSVLHQSEYTTLLVELLLLRVTQAGVLREWTPPA
ncbi:hypothetical protein FHS99_002341 [Sphingomonas prati]|uniref:Uncharacterized protein n=1 Tax=Sphingomonas prati TaxID=1843237 RepID=A0A7W9F3T0_9SPHN|nr:hypothetical protein [Sphingomonas prati]